MLDADLKAVIYRHLEAAREEIRRAIVDEGLEASGRTAAEMYISDKDNGAVLTGRQAFWTLEQGRGPGRTPRDLPEIIRQWAIDKGITLTPKPYARPGFAGRYTAEERALRDFSHAVAWKIRQTGTQRHREGPRRTVYTPAVDQAVEACARDILLTIQKRIK